MNPTHGVCTNLPEACGLAASRQPQPMADGQGRCSGCGAALMVPAAVPAAAAPSPLRWLVPLLALLLAGAALAWWLTQRAPRATPAEPAAAAATGALATAASAALAAGSAPPPLPAGAAVPTIRLLGSNTVGAALERAGHLLEQALGVSAHSAPFAALGKLRSAGIRDLRQSALMKVRNGITSLAEINRVTKD